MKPGVRKYRAAECVNRIKVKVNSSTCKQIESKDALMTGAVQWMQTQGVMPEQ